MKTKFIIISLLFVSFSGFSKSKDDVIDKENCNSLTTLVDYKNYCDEISEAVIWNFIENNDALIAVANDLKAHINGTTILTGAQIAEKKSHIFNARESLDDSPEIILAFKNLIEVYDAAYGAIFLPGSTITSFDRNKVSDEDIHWVILSIMQYVFDEVFNNQSLSNPQILAVIDGYKFASSTNFPGAVDPPANPSVSHTAKISASFSESLRRETQAWGEPARKPTGTYLAPGSIVTVEVPEDLANKGYFIRVGAHSWDHEAGNRPPIKRLSRASLVYPIINKETIIASPYGGGIYIDVPKGANAGVVDVKVTGAVRSPYFSYKSFHTTTNADWVNTERNHTAPWADFQSDKFMMQVPTSWIYALEDPTKLMQEWDAAMDAINDLMGFPRIRGKETMYIQTDVILRYRAHAPGYPATNVNYNPSTNENGFKNNYFIRGPETGSETEFHEQGHAYRFPRFANTNEAEVNLLYVAMANKVYGMDLGKAFFRSFGPGDKIVENQIDHTAMFWMTSFSFTPRESPMGNWEAAYQAQGYARYVDLARLFGWDGLGEYWKSMNYNSSAGVQIPGSNDERLVRLCEKIGADVSPLWHFWGIHPADITSLKSNIKGMGIEPSPEVYNLLQSYKDIIPSNNAEYQEFCLLWYGKEPSINGYGAERERTRQFDNTSYWEGKWTYSGTDPNQLDGEIYNEASAERVLNRLQDIIDLYFPEGNPSLSITGQNVENDLLVYYNNDRLYVDHTISNEYCLSFYNMLGQSLLTFKNESSTLLKTHGVDISSLAGMYILKIEDSSGQNSSKIKVVFN